MYVHHPPFIPLIITQTIVLTINRADDNIGYNFVGRAARFQELCDNRESGKNPEQSCCRMDGVFPRASDHWIESPGRFGKVMMSKSEDLPTEGIDANLSMLFTPSPECAGQIVDNHYLWKSSAEIARRKIL